MDNKRLLYKFFFGKNFRILRHLIFWLFIYLDEIFSLIGLTPPLDDYSSHLFGFLALFTAIMINLYYLVPQFLIKGKTFLYFLFTLLLVSMVIFIDFKLDRVRLDVGMSFFDYYIPELGYNTAILAFAVAIKMSKHFFLNRVKVEELKQHGLQTELAMLKNQVNPHFMFNTLNSLYVMSKKNDKNLSESIMMLSDLMRYQLYDADHEKVSLKKELEYIQNYIDLEEMRRSDLKVTFQIEGDVLNKEISPLLLLPFVENGFKHSFTIEEEKNQMAIDVKIEDYKLSFDCKNNKGISETGPGGIGLKNVKRRLELLYPNAYKLENKLNDGFYFVHLEIEL